MTGANTDIIFQKQKKKKKIRIYFVLLCVGMCALLHQVPVVRVFAIVSFSSVTHLSSRHQTVHVIRAKCHNYLSLHVFLLLLSFTSDVGVGVADVFFIIICAAIECNFFFFCWTCVFFFLQYLRRPYMNLLIDTSATETS